MSTRRLIRKTSSDKGAGSCDVATSNSSHQPTCDSDIDNRKIPTGERAGGSLPRSRKKVSLTRSRSFMDSSGPQRRILVLAKQDNEAFGFEIQTYRLEHRYTFTMDTCTYVCKVHENSPAYIAGLTAGDILATINGVRTEGFSHKETVDLIKSSGNFLRVETVNGASTRRHDLEAKLQVLKKQLHEKWVELQSLLVQEQRLIHGSGTDCSNENINVQEIGFLHSPSSWSSNFLNKHRFSSGSSYKSRLSSMTEDSEDAFYQTSVYDDSASETFSRQTSEDEECFFASGNGVSARKLSLRRDRSISVASSGSAPASPVWDTCSLSNAFGTLPRKSRRETVRKHILRFIPGLHKSVEEEESCV
ncbi:cytohesin-interacting protein [Lissotriton helveticus]